MHCISADWVRCRCTFRAVALHHGIACGLSRNSIAAVSYLAMLVVLATRTHAMPHLHHATLVLHSKLWIHGLHAAVAVVACVCTAHAHVSMYGHGSKHNATSRLPLQTLCAYRGRAPAAPVHVVGVIVALNTRGVVEHSCMPGVVVTTFKSKFTIKAHVCASWDAYVCMMW
jgi:hypothetical protein